MELEKLNPLVHDAITLLTRANSLLHPIVYSSSLGAESVVLTDLICKYIPTIDIFTINTGYLPKETLDLLTRQEEFYNRKIKVVTPNNEVVLHYVKQYGQQGFYNGITERKNCCDIRKVQPFKNAIKGYNAWVTGIRKEQSEERLKGELIVRDEKYNLWKISPLLNWKESDIWEYIREHNLPYNTLHDKGYPSIGCEPCTRAIKSGEHSRAGRWWWENSEEKECGIQS